MAHDDDAPAAPLRYTLRLTDRELVRAYLFTFFRQRGAIFLRFIGLAAIAWGVHDAVAGRPLAPLLILWGVWYALRPLFQAWVIVRRRGGRGQVTVELDDAGLRIEQDGQSARFAWDQLKAAGGVGDLVWYELERGAVGTLPLRVVDDPDALERCFRAHGKWRGPDSRGRIS